MLLINRCITLLDYNLLKISYLVFKYIPFLFSTFIYRSLLNLSFMWSCHGIKNFYLFLFLPISNVETKQFDRKKKKKRENIKVKFQYIRLILKSRYMLYLYREKSFVNQVFRPTASEASASERHGGSSPPFLSYIPVMR